MPYFQSHDKDFTLYLGDTVKVCGELIDKKVDCIFADPPYFLSKEFKIRTKSGYVREFDKGEWDRVRSPQEVHDFNSRWITACKRVLKPSGTFGLAEHITIYSMSQPACKNKASKYSISLCGKSLIHQPPLLTNVSISPLNISFGQGARRKLHIISTMT